MTPSNEIAQNSDIGTSSCKPTPHKGLRLKYPIYGRGVFCPTPVRLHYYLVCDSDLQLYNVEGLINQFEFFLTRWFASEKGRKRISAPKYRACIDMLLANLRYAQLEGKQLLAPTRREATNTENPSKIGYQVVNTTLEYLESKGFIKLVRGTASEFEGACTWCEPKAPLVAIFERQNIRAQLHANTALVEIRRRTNLADSRSYEIIPITKRLRPQARRLGAPAVAYNEIWLNHMPTLDDRYIVPWCRRIFNDSLDYGGRFYGSFQQLPKTERARLNIDGEPTLEPDYSAYHINILYSWCNEQLIGDPYQVDGYSRNIVKAVMLPLLNTENLSNLAGQITKSGKPAIQDAHAEWEETSFEYRKFLAQGIRYEPKKKPPYLKGFIKDIPTGLDGKALIMKIKEKHQSIAHFFGSSKIGLRLQKQDSEIMGAVIYELSKRGIPVLPVHDSLRCKVADLVPVVDTMKEQYQNKTGFTICVDVHQEGNRKLSYLERMSKNE